MSLSAALELPSLVPERRAAPSPRAGVIVDGRYSIARLISEGDDYALYEASHVFTGQHVALKQVHPGRARASADPSDALREALLGEARVLTVAQHSFVATLFDAGIDIDGEGYMAMELIAGRRLDTVLAAQGVLAPNTAVSIAMQLLAALAQMHRRGVTHNAIRPEHIMLLADDEGKTRCKLTGFGHAALHNEWTPPSLMMPTSAPEYAPPEAQMSRRAAPDVDIYAVAAVLYECLTGAPPRTGLPLDVVTESRTFDVIAPSHRNADLPANLDPVLVRALQRDRVARFTDAAQLYLALREVVRPKGTPPSNRPDSRRTHSRAPYACPIRLHINAEQSTDGHCQDISLGGMMIQIGRDLADQLRDQDKGRHRRVQVRFPTPMTGHVATVTGHLRWLREGRTGGVMGLAFDDLPKQLADSISSYVALMGPGAPLVGERSSKETPALRY